MQKKIFMLTILIIGIFAVGAVCATDNLTGDIVGTNAINEDVVCLEEIDDKSIGVENDNHVLLDEDDTIYGFNSLADDINKTLPGGILSLTHDYQYLDGDSPIVIENPISIYGNGHYIDACQMSRIFHITSFSVYLENITFMNGKSDYAGGAIHWSGLEGKISDCTFINNFASDGGAIYFNVESSSVSSCNFIDNAVTGYGGAISYKGGVGFVSNSNFSNNNASRGGAIYIYETLESSIEDCSFVKCYADYGGGAVYWSDNDKGQIARCSFENNSASCGGAIFWNNGYDGNVSTCYFTDNRASLGSAFYASENKSNKSSILKFNDNILFNNGDVGSELYFANSTDYNTDYNWFGNNATDYQNNASKYCDVWLFLSATANPNSISLLNTANITFNLYAYNSTSDKILDYDVTRLMPINLTITPKLGSIDNHAMLGDSITYTPKSVGEEAIVASWGDVNFTLVFNVTIPSFTELNQIINGNGDSEVYLNCDFRWTPDDYNFTGGINISRAVTIYGNNFTIDGAGQASIFNIYQADGLSLNNITFINGKASGDSGVITLDQTSVSIVNCTFVNNSADEGGAIKGWYANNCNIIDCWFINNTANMGGAIYIMGDNNNVQDCHFIHNHAANQGGAIEWAAYSNGGTVTGCYFEDNSAGNGGAVVWYAAPSGSLSDCYFINNNAGDGGAITWESDSGSVSDSYFINNGANEGGAIYWFGEDSSVTGCYFLNNSAGDGSVYRNYENYGNHHNSKFNNNILLNNTGCEIKVEETSNSNIDYNWFGNNASNYNVSLANVDGVSLNNWYFLDIGLSQSLANVSLNKLYNVTNDTISVVDDFNIPNVSLNLTGVNLTVPKAKNIQNGTFDISISPELNNYSLTASFYTASYTKSTQIGDFDCLQNKINNARPNSIIELDRNYTYTEGLDTIIEGVEVNLDNVTINGNGFTVNASGKSRIFIINGFNVTIKNITLSNGNSVGDAYHYAGGAIHWNGNNGSIYNCNFVNNNGGAAGAILCAGNNSFVSNCTFVNNTAVGIYGNYGGAIYLMINTNSSISDCYFANNHAVSDGGAIYAISSDNCAISNCTFVNCWSNEKGGAISLSSTNCSVSDCYFENNHGDWAGAVFYYYTKYGSISNCYFVNNFAVCGGAIAVSYSDYYSISSCYFVNNSADASSVYYDANSGYRDSATFNNNILLNNNGNEIYYENPQAYNTDNNWFGNDATDYDNNTREFSKIWLFLNATANPNTISVLNSSDIAFKLYVYDSTSNTVYDYDNDLLMPINFTITSKLGSVDKNISNLNETIQFTPTKGGTGSVTASIENVKFTIELNITKIDSNLLVRPIQDVSYGENATINLNYNNTATGMVNITLTGKKHEYSYTNEMLNAAIMLQSDILPDDYNITVIYSGDDKFLNATANTTLTVKKITPNIYITAYDINVSDVEAVMFKLTLPANANGNLTININGAVSTVNVTKMGKIEKGYLTINLTNKAYSVGEYNLTATYGDDIYSRASAKSTSNILIVKTEIIPTTKTMDLIVGDASKVTYTLNPSDAKGNIIFSTSNPSVIEIDSVGNIKALAEGSCTITINFSGCENYTASSNTVEINISKAKSSVSADSIECVEGETAVLLVNVTDGATGKVFVEFDGVKFYGDISNNVASVSIIGLVAGNYVADVIYSGDTKFESSYASVNVKVNLKPASKIGSSIAITVIDGNNLTAILKDIEGKGIGNAKVNYIINGKNESVETAVDGSFVIEGKYDVPIAIAYEGDNATEATNFTVIIKQSIDMGPVKIKSRFNIIGGSITIKGYAVDKKADENGIAYSTELLDANGNPIKGVKIQFALNSKVYNRTTNENGSFNPYNLNMARAGVYTMAFYFAGNGNYTSAFASVAVNLDKKPIKIKASNKNYKKSTKTKKYTVTLSTIVGSSADGKVHLRTGLKVSMRINGKTYSGKTNSKGQVTFKITNMSKKAKYKAKISYAGDNTYESASKTVTLTVK